MLRLSLLVVLLQTACGGQLGLFPRAPRDPAAAAGAAGAGSGTNATAGGSGTNATGVYGDVGEPATQGAAETAFVAALVGSMLVASVLGTWVEIHAVPGRRWRGFKALRQRVAQVRAEGGGVQAWREFYDVACRFMRWWAGGVVFLEFTLVWTLTFPADEFSDELLGAITPTYGPGFKCTNGPTAGWEGWGYVRCFKYKDPTVIDVFEGLGIAQAIGQLLQHALRLSSAFFITNGFVARGVALYRLGALASSAYAVKEFAMNNTCSGVLFLTTLAHMLGAAFAMKHGFMDLQGAAAEEGGGGGGEGAARSEAATASMVPVVQSGHAQKKNDAAADVI